MIIDAWEFGKFPSSDKLRRHFKLSLYLPNLETKDINIRKPEQQTQLNNSINNNLKCFSHIYTLGVVQCSALYVTKEVLDATNITLIA